MLVQELYMDALRFEESLLAHFIYHLVSEGKISLQDNIRKLDQVQVEPEKIIKLFQTNKLGFYKIGIYSLKMNRKKFVFIFAQSEEEAINFFTASFQSKPLNCIEYPLDFELVRGKGVVSFRELKKEFKHFPAIAGFFERLC